MNINDIITTVRYLINDVETPAIDIFTCTTSAIFTLSEPNVTSIIDVAVNDVGSSYTYTYSSVDNKVTIITSINTGDTIEINYNCYQNYSDTELESYIRSAIVHLSVLNVYTWKVEDTNDVYPEPTDEEKNLIAMVASILISPSISITLPDITLKGDNKKSTTEKIFEIVSSWKKNCHGIFTIINTSDKL